MKNTYRKIKLTQGKCALVSPEDFDFINRFKWTFDGRYARRNLKGKKIYMHQIIVKTPVGWDTDHINHNKLDNRRANLRVCTRTYNNYNQPLRKDNTSGYKGISWRPDSKKWRVRIYKGNREIRLGLFKELKDAIKVRELYIANFL